LNRAKAWVKEHCWGKIWGGILHGGWLTLGQQPHGLVSPFKEARQVAELTGQNKTGKWRPIRHSLLMLECNKTLKK
jgi:hypothetical protein